VLSLTAGALPWCQYRWASWRFHCETVRSRRSATCDLQQSALTVLATSSPVETAVDAVSHQTATHFDHYSHSAPMSSYCSI